MKTRIITGISAAALFIIALLLPPTVFRVAWGIIMLIMLHEIYDSAKTSRSVRIMGFISSLIVYSVVYAAHGDLVNNPVFLIMMILFAAIMLIYMAAVVVRHGKENYKSILSSGALTMYITLTMSSILVLKDIKGTSSMMLIFICAWLTDTGAYFSGRAFGKHKLIPNVSPKKTVEGFFGGIAVSAVSCVIYTYFLDKLGFASYSVVLIAGAGIICSAASQLGDLVASAIKRDEGIKDFGKIFPGHGGFMDRFDSVIYIAPIMAALLLI